MDDKLKIWIGKNIKGDPIIWGIILVLSVFSLIIVYSSVGTLTLKRENVTAESILLKHGFLVVLSLVLTWLAHKVNYKWYWGVSKIALYIAPVLLIYGFFFGSKMAGATRAINILGLSFQMADFAKLALITSVARILAKRQREIDKAFSIESVEQIMNRSMWPAILWCSVICGLIALFNFSTAAILFATCMLLMFIGRVPLKQIMTLFLVGGFAVSLALVLGQRWGTFISRIDKFFKEGDTVFQAQQSFIAIWRGGYFGLGPGNGIQKDFLPLSYSDFVYSTIIEEFGLIMAIFVIFLYLGLLYRSTKVVINSNRAFGGLLSAGLALSIVIQAMVNMGVAVGLGPITGQPLPLLSMGGTSLLFTGISLGIILSVSRGDIEEDEEGELSARNGEEEEDE
jgi:cell division protein FtsW